MIYVTLTNSDSSLKPFKCLIIAHAYMLQEKYREKNKELHMVFVDLEKAYDRVPRELIWWSLRKKRVPEAYIKIIQDMYEDCETKVTTREGNTEYFNVKVGLHQGSAISPLLFIIIMDVLASEIDKEPPWAMLFADDLVLCETSKAAVERENWRYGETNSKDMD